MRGLPVIVVAALALGALSGVMAYDAQPGSGAWREIAWPFPRDGWPAGRAFRCDVTVCGEQVELYLRPKIGFCNCDRGVADDDEVDRVADVDLLSEKFVGVEAGKTIRIADLLGRARRYDLQMPDGSRAAALGIAVSRRCDLFVAVARSKSSGQGAQQAALDFLRSGSIDRWMIAALEGR